MIHNENQFSDLLEKLSLHVDGTDMVGDLYDMHEKFGVREVVERFDNQKLLTFLQFRLDFLQEELNEAKLAKDKLESLMDSEAPAEVVAVEARDAADDIVDAMIDLCVVAIGTLDAYQVDADLAWTRVHEANMQKEPGVKASRPNPLGLPDLIKPEGWTAPQHGDNIGLMERFVPRV